MKEKLQDITKNKNYYKGLLETAICQQIWKSRGNR